jgi:DNA polymerase (family 10)
MLVPNLTQATNQQIAELLKEIAAAYEVKGEDRFRIAAYRRAADAVEHAASDLKDLWEAGRLAEIPGIGKALAEHLDEYFRRGQVAHFEQVKRGLPPGMFNLMKVPGVGPKSAYKIAKLLKVKSLADLKKACEKGQVARLPDFGEVSQADILKGIAAVERRGTRVLLPVAEGVAQKVTAVLEKVPGVKRVDALGSLRRRVPTVGDIDLAVATTQPSLAIKAFVAMPEVGRVLAQGPAKASVVLTSGYQVDLRVQSPSSYGAQLQYFTGSKEHNIHLRKLALERGLSLSEYGIREVKSQKSKVKIFKTEEEFYRALGMPWIPPEIREDTGEIETALRQAQGKPEGLPNLVELADIKGDLHVHCDFPLEESHDPGLMKMEEIAKKASELGYEYVALGNHSPSVSRHTPTQVVQLLKKKNREIESLRPRFPAVKLLNVVEVDILTDGQLALDDEALSLLDVVIVSVHSSFLQSQAKMTERVLRALRNPRVHIFGHPTGRLVQEREGYELDWEVIFRACWEGDKVLEVNAYPKRLDLPEELVREAVRRGVKMVINTDAHDLSQLDLMCYGVYNARRGWAQKKDILNTLSWPEFWKKLRGGQKPTTAGPAAEQPQQVLASGTAP